MMPFTDKEKKYLDSPHGHYCVTSPQMLVAYLNVLFDRAPNDRLTLDDPDVRAFLGYRD